MTSRSMDDEDKMSMADQILMKMLYIYTQPSV